MIVDNSHLTYCTNIHPGESWAETFDNLKVYAKAVKQKIARDKKFGIGLRLSNHASLELINGNNLTQFKDWLSNENIYVFTLNGFPYGNFHKKAVKDLVHSPDWTTSERLDYTKRLFDILADILPKETDGGISTSSISYKYWHGTENAMELAKQVACEHFADVAILLFNIKNNSGKHLHLDIEPEPDGVIETSKEFVDYFENHLLKTGKAKVMKELGVSSAQGEELIRDHIQVCYDVCHFAVGYEDPETVLNLFEQNGIGVGKIQISSALKADLNQPSGIKEEIKKHLASFDEPVYLHQAILKQSNGNLLRFRDLKPALLQLADPDVTELRTHYHVPIFTDHYHLLKSTSNDIVKVLDYWKKKRLTNPLEVETYTWDVLPGALKLDLTDSICRELEWVLKVLSK